ncbi:carboxymuconolactone decarboxylase family protein [Paraburkholderia caledonica]
MQGHTKEVLKAGASENEIMEVVWVATEMRAGAAYAHSALALDDMTEERQSREVQYGGASWTT